MRNPSKNTIKKLIRHEWQRADYFFFNEVGAHVWRMSKRKICNRNILTSKAKKYMRKSNSSEICTCSVQRWNNRNSNVIILDARR